MQTACISFVNIYAEHIVTNTVIDTLHQSWKLTQMYLPTENRDCIIKYALTAYFVFSNPYHEHVSYVMICSIVNLVWFHK